MSQAFWGICRYFPGTLVIDILPEGNFWPFPSINSTKNIVFSAFMAKHKLSTVCLEIGFYD